MKQTNVISLREKSMDKRLDKRHAHKVLEFHSRSEAYVIETHLKNLLNVTDIETIRKALTRLKREQRKVA